jgi:hypothetical protein
LNGRVFSVHRCRRCGIAVCRRRTDEFASRAARANITANDRRTTLTCVKAARHCAREWLLLTPLIKRVRKSRRRRRDVRNAMILRRVEKLSMRTRKHRHNRLAIADELMLVSIVMRMLEMTTALLFLTMVFFPRVIVRMLTLTKVLTKILATLIFLVMVFPTIFLV